MACSERFSGLELRISAQRSIYFILEIAAKKLYIPHLFLSAVLFLISGSGQEGHLPAFFQDVPDKKVLVHIVQILVDEMAPAGFPDIS